MRFPAPARLGQPAAPRDATRPRAGRLVGAAGLAAGLAALLPGAAVAQACPPAPGEMCDLSDLVGNSPSDESTADGISGDGKSITGTVSTDISSIYGEENSHVHKAFLLERDENPKARYQLAEDKFFVYGTFGFTSAHGMSDDGQVTIVKTSSSGIPYRWSRTSGPVPLFFPEVGFAWGVNDDGTTIVGQIKKNFGGRSQAFVWTGDPNERDIETVKVIGIPAEHSGSTSGAYDVSDTGVVVGWYGQEGGQRVAFRWSADLGFDSLGTLSMDNSAQSFARAISDNGQVIVGGSTNGKSDGDFRPFRWSVEYNMIDLGTLKANDNGSGQANSVNEDGSVVVGFAESDSGSMHAFRWTTQHGMEDLGTLADNNSGQSSAKDVTDDGKVVVGWAENNSGLSRAFIWRAGTMLDHANTGNAVQQSAQALAATAAHYGQNTVYQLGREVALRAPGGGEGARVSTRGEAAPQRPVAVRVGGRLAHTDDVATSGGAEVTAAVGLTPTLTLGGFVEIMDETDSHSVVSLDGTHIAGGASLRYRAAPDGTGLTWRVAAVRGGGDFDVTRRDILPNTERGEGATSLTTTGLSAEIGYGYAVPRGVVTPFARLTGSRVERDGFAESDAIAFPLTYDDHEDEALTVTLGADARLDVSAQGTLKLGAGISHDLDRDTDPVTGTSAIPGFTNFSVDGPDLENRTRGHVSAGYSHALGAGRAISGSVSLSQSPWTNDVSVGARVGYEMRF